MNRDQKTELLLSDDVETLRQWLKILAQDKVSTHHFDNEKLVEKYDSLFSLARDLGFFKPKISEKHNLFYVRIEHKFWTPKQKPAVRDDAWYAVSNKKNIGLARVILMALLEQSVLLVD